MTNGIEQEMMHFQLGMMQKQVELDWLDILLLVRKLKDRFLIARMWYV